MIDEVIDLMRVRGTSYDPSTIRTQITSALCTNAPKNHPTVYDDFIRVAPGFYKMADGSLPPRSAAGPLSGAMNGALDAAAQFEIFARVAMERRYGTTLSAGKVPGVPKRFDFLSADFSVVGDAKFYTLVKGTGMPPAKHSTIAEYVWLLEKTAAPHTFLVFGNDVRVPQGWLRRFRALTTVDFLFLNDDGSVIDLRLGHSGS
ncbi:MAG TPA: hypothetical protein VFN37_07160 [Candidatus Baltobacteraceae bacterium]|nr:hypothetical protein [Candidatus Baltobacteraceae bacterium]